MINSSSLSLSLSVKVGGNDNAITVIKSDLNESARYTCIAQICCY